jgi:hypothetical protein
MSRIKYVAAFVMAVASASACAGPVLNFDGSRDGARIDNYYNGGTDQFGNMGGDFGVTFVGGIVHMVNGLSYLTGVTEVRIAGGESLGLSFNYSTRQTEYRNGVPVGDPGMNDFYIETHNREGKLLDGYFMDNTTTGTDYCTARVGTYCTFGRKALGVSPGDSIASFTFSPNAAIDTLSLATRVAPPNEYATPEPGTLSAFALGLLLICARRQFNPGRR